MSFPGNCLVVAIVAWLRHPLSTKVHVMRNRGGRWHVYWSRGERRFEFHSPGASKCGYARNALRLGSVREIGT